MPGALMMRPALGSAGTIIADIFSLVFYPVSSTETLLGGSVELDGVAHQGFRLGKIGACFFRGLGNYADPRFWQIWNWQIRKWLIWNWR